MKEFVEKEGFDYLSDVKLWDDLLGFSFFHNKGLMNLDKDFKVNVIEKYSAQKKKLMRKNIRKELILKILHEWKHSALFNDEELERIALKIL